MSGVSKLNIPIADPMANIGIQNSPLKKDSGAERQQIKELSQQFEAMFHDIVLKSMRSSVDKSGFIDGGNAEDIYRSMLDSEYAKMMSEQGGGLAVDIEKQLLESAGLKEKIAKKINEIGGQKAYGTQGLHLQSK